MPGNESEVLKFILSNKNHIRLNGIDKIKTIKVPKEGSFLELKSLEDLSKVDSSDSTKKADFYINDVGISIKQEGSSPLYNKAQRKHLKDFFNFFFKENISSMIINNLDKEVKQYHLNRRLRDIRFSEIMSEDKFKKVLKYLMLDGNADLKNNDFKAKLILVSKKKPNKIDDLNFMNFDKFFLRYKSLLVFALRRTWVGQLSKHEHSRALSISKVSENQKWVFNEVSGKPRAKKGKLWRDDFDQNARKTVYYLNINLISEKK